MRISSEEFIHYRPLLFSLGYRMVGTISDTEDLIQETYMKIYEVDITKVENKKAYLCKTMTNLCLDFLKSARYRREEYIGEWNPEPLIINQTTDNDPSDIVIQKEGLSIAYLRMMENLKPNERAVIILREVFEFSYQEIAEVIEMTKSNSRKIYSRAKQKLNKVEHESLNYEQNKGVVNRFIHSVQFQNKEDVLKLISDQVTLYSDGGGKVQSATRPVSTSPKVLAFFSGLSEKIPDDYYYEIQNVNGQPAVLNFLEGHLQSIISFYIVEGEIKEIYITLNPEKLPK
ncbi:RNA polymerase sigma-70 factor [Filobacillus milosensis]|uniref:RNA polymerase sigma-70 factor n=1 Tax=Filobacillus milosensis TaxID=94137 RepID=A0A4Y8IRV4_9BACI|nr:RNA polymerase sigma-70 factor [Filobacillus milosensis]TFB21333.1 RNA polymerase sigma-70 factor [Filobacillus milosensis]